MKLANLPKNKLEIHGDIGLVFMTKSVKGISYMTVIINQLFTKTGVLQNLMGILGRIVLYWVHGKNGLIPIAPLLCPLYVNLVS